MAPKTATGPEAAAIAAAIAAFEAEMGGAAAAPPAPSSPWQRTALVEGVSAKETIQAIEDPGGGSRWLS